MRRLPSAGSATSVATARQPLRELRAPERNAEIRSFLLVVSGYLALPLYPLFWLADLLYWPSRAAEFLGLRLLVVAALFLLNRQLVRRDGSLAWTERMGIAFFAITAWPITVMIWLTEGAASPYYAGLNLVALAFLASVPFTRRSLAVCTLVTYGPYLVTVALAFWGATGPESVRLAIVHVFFVAATVVICLVVRHFTERLRLRELMLRLELDEELRSRERIIAEKTAEAVHLRDLATRFSPQVIRSIENGDIELGAIHRAPICALFVDIVKSTDRIVRVHPDHVHRVIQTFLETSMKVLLEHDITIDKFLGDGVLAFSNDPVARPDYVERVVSAARQIRSRVAADEARLSAYWPGRFQLRFGVASGEASVGFYGSPDYTQTYTAIGPVMNLASRLCSMAQPDQILVSKAVADRLAATAMAQVHLTGNYEIQGFAGHQKVYTIGDEDEHEVDAPSVGACPAGHGELQLVTKGGILVLGCPTCAYQLPA